MTTTPNSTQGDSMTALADITDPRFTADQLATLAAFDAAPTPPEVAEAAATAALASVTHSAACHCTVCELRGMFDAAPTPPEVVEAALVETVARAMYDAGNRLRHIPWEDAPESVRNWYRSLAAAAIAAYRAKVGGAEEAVRRYPCYCLPGAARCDDPYNWCDRVAQLESSHERAFRAAGGHESELPTPEDEARGRRFARMRTDTRASAIAALIAETRAEARRAALAAQAGDER